MNRLATQMKPGAVHGGRDLPHVLHVTPTLDARAGGPPVVVARLAGLAEASGFSASILTTGAASCAGQDAGRIDVLRGQAAAIAGTGRDRLVRAVERADLVHLHTLWSPLVALAARVARATGTPHVLSPHGMLDPWSMRQKALKKRIYWRLVERGTARGAERIVFTTKEEKRRAEASAGGTFRSAVVALGADPPPASRQMLAREFLGAAPELAGRPILVFLGRMHDKKRPELLIEAMVAILRDRPDAVAILAGGGDPATLRALEARARALGVRDAVRFLGHLDGRAKWRALAAGTVFVLPSQQENFAIAAAEALALGLPVLLSASVNICADVVAAGAGRALDEADLTGSIAAHALDLMEDAARHGEMSKKASALAAARYTWPAAAADMHGLYARVLEERT